MRISSGESTYTCIAPPRRNAFTVVLDILINRYALYARNIADDFGGKKKYEQHKRCLARA